jgi:hypothetical protein
MTSADTWLFVTMAPANPCLLLTIASNTRKRKTPLKIQSSRNSISVQVGLTSQQSTVYGNWKTPRSVLWTGGKEMIFTENS